LSLLEIDRNLGLLRGDKIFGLNNSSRYWEKLSSVKLIN